MTRLSHKRRSLALLAGIAVSVPAICQAQYESEDTETEVTEVSADAAEAPVQKPERVKVVRVEVPVAVPVPVPATPPVPMAQPSTFSFDEPVGRPPYIEREPNIELIVGGTFVLVSAYGFSAMTAASSPVTSDERLFIPVVGPWLDLAERPNCGRSRPRPACDMEPTNKAMLVASGTVQSLGALLMLGGVLFPKLTIVPGTRSAKLEVVPQAGPGVAGLMTRGQLGF